MKMKNNLVFALIAALTLGACSKSEITRSLGKDEAISFTTYAGRPLKAGSSFVEGGDFSAVPNPKINVWADLRTETSAWTGSFNFMNNVEVTLVSGGSLESMEYEDLRYWPKDATKNFITFWAYYPSRDSHFTDVPAGLGDYEWTVDSDVSKQEDLMFAEALVDQTRYSNDGVVNFTFHHQLTQIRFFVKASSLGPTVSSIRLDSLIICNIDVKDTITTSCVDHALKSEWKGNTTGNVTFKVSTTAQYALAEKQPVGEVYLMLPQSLKNASAEEPDVQYAKIAYTVSYNDPVHSESFVESIPLYTESVSKWKANQKINYILDLSGSLQPIFFAADVSSWDSESGHVFIVN